jgi:parallel beta-helix repeat protein
MYSKTKTKAILLLLVFSFAIVFLADVRVVRADNEIRIRADGKVDGTDKIKRDGDLYTFTGDIGTDEWSYGIVIKKDNIVIDGADYLLRGHGEQGLLSPYPDIYGITLEGRNNVTIKNLQISGFNYGFRGNCSNIKIVGNNLTDNPETIFFVGSYNNTVSGNNITGNGEGTGIFLDFCFNSTFSENVIINCYYGINFYSTSCNNTVSGNIVKENLEIGIFIRSSSNYNILTGNAVTDNYKGISIVSSNNIVSGNNISNNHDGIGLAEAYNNTVSGNIITGNSENGLWLTGQAENNAIFENNITDNKKGIMMFQESSNNSIYLNNFNNTINVYDQGVDSGNSLPSVNIWDNGTEGNYWSSYNGTDSNEDGIGDTPYIIDENNQDNYPLIEPVEIPEFPSWIILPLFLMATLSVIFFNKRLFERP